MLRKKTRSKLQASLLAVLFSLLGELTVLVRRRLIVQVPFEPFCLDGRLVFAAGNALGVLIAALTAARVDGRVVLAAGGPGLLVLVLLVLRGRDFDRVLRRLADHTRSRVGREVVGVH